MCIHSHRRYHRTSKGIRFLLGDLSFHVGQVVPGPDMHTFHQKYRRFSTCGYIYIIASRLCEYYTNVLCAKGYLEQTISLTLNEKLRESLTLQFVARSGLRPFYPFQRNGNKEEEGDREEKRDNKKVSSQMMRIARSRTDPRQG